MSKCAFNHFCVRLVCLLVVPLLTLPIAVNAQEADAVLGRWYTEEDQAVVEISKKGDTYIGKILLLKEPLEKDGSPKLDKKNPDQAKRSQPIIGLQFMSNFKFNAGQWTDGTIYDPEKGETYSCKMYLEGSNLVVRGYILGMPFLGRSQTWKRNKRN
jgi:uncharacterized protein (DUF2147 family)